MRKDMKVGLVVGVLMLVAVIIIVVMQKGEPAGEPVAQAPAVKPVEPVIPKPAPITPVKPVEPVKPTPVQPEDDLLSGLLDPVAEDVEELDDLIEGIAVVDNNSGQAGVVRQQIDVEVDDVDKLGQAIETIQNQAGSIPKEAALPKEIYHTVASGESLSGISLKYFGSVNFTKDIYEANKTVMTRGEDFLNVGWKLRIPHPSEVEAKR